MNIKQAAYNIGIFHGAVAHGVNPHEAHKLDGCDAELEEHFRKTAHKKVMKAAHNLTELFGYSQSKEARLLNALSTVERDKSIFTKHASDLVFDTILRVKQEHTLMEKSASLGKALSGTGEIVGTGAKFGLGLGAAVVGAGGAGLGAAYWKLKRDAEEQSVKNKLQKQKIDYYNQLTDELVERLGGEYS
jgi:hypothetical protein